MRLLPLLLSYFGVSSSSVGVSATVLITSISAACATGATPPKVDRNEHPVAAAMAARREKSPPIMAFFPPRWLPLRITEALSEQPHDLPRVAVARLGNTCLLCPDVGAVAYSPESTRKTSRTIRLSCRTTAAGQAAA